MKKFGRVLTSRQLGKEAFLAIKPVISGISGKEKLEIDFEGVSSLSPSWADEFLRPLLEEHGQRVCLENVDNDSIKRTLSFLEEIGSI